MIVRAREKRDLIKARYKKKEEELEDRGDIV
jgi:hypothetical protein